MVILASHEWSALDSFFRNQTRGFTEIKKNKAQKNKKKKQIHSKRFKFNKKKVVAENEKKQSHSKIKKVHRKKKLSPDYPPNPCNPKFSELRTAINSGKL